MTDLFLIACINGHDIAIDARQIDAVVDIGPVVPVPRADPAIRGLAALRSRVATVIDTRLVLGLPPTPDGLRRAVTTNIDGHLYAFLVDALDDVAPFDRQPLTGVALGAAWRGAAAGLIERDGKPLLIVDLAVLAGAGTALAA